MAEKATEKQKAYIRGLQKNNHFTIAGTHQGNYLDRMSKVTAAGWIAALLKGVNPHTSSLDKLVGTDQLTAKERSAAVSAALTALDVMEPTTSL